MQPSEGPSSSGLGLRLGEGPFTSCLKDVRPSTAMTVGWQFTGSAFTLPVNALRGHPTPMYQKVNSKLLRWKDASITKMSSDMFLEWFTRCGETPHGSVRKFLGVRYFRPIESKCSVKTAVPSANMNEPSQLTVWNQ